MNMFDVADIDGDGDPDLAMVLPTLRWFQNDGGGTFTTIPIVGGTDCYGILLTDIDGDLDPDIVLAYFYPVSGYLIKLVNIGGGAFGPETVAGANSAASNGLIAADLDGDGDQDILYRKKLWDIGPRALSILVNDGSGTFSGGNSICLAGDQWAHYCTGDLNGDAAADIVAYAGDGLKFKLGNSSIEHRLNSLQGPKQICAANFIGDPLPEAVVCGELLIGPLNEAPSPLQMAMHENLGGGLMRENPGPLWLSLSAMLNATPVDLNSDGAMDLVALWEHQWGTSKRYVAFINDGFGQLDSASAIGSLFSNFPSGSLLPYLRDLDLDGDTDLMHYDGNQMVVCLNNGNGTFAPESDYPLNGTACLCDVNGDGYEDFVWWYGTMSWDANNGLGVPGTAQATGNAPIRPTSKGSPSNVYPMFGTDLDNDGWEDLVLFSGDSLGTMRNTGGNLAPVQAWSCNAADYALGDMDGDGFKDLVVIRTNSDVVLYPNTGNCTFGPEQLLASAPGSTGSSDIDLADMDGDGRLDVLTCSATGSAAWLGNDLPLTAHATSISAGHAIRVFPNPFTDRTRIVFKEELGADVLIEIRDVQGRLLRSVHGTGSREMMIDRGDLGPGLYLVRALRNNAQFGAARLVVE